MSLSDILPASFRGVPFGVFRTEDQNGRRLVVHQYPGRDTPWTEDLGRAARRWRFTAFLLQDDLVYGGGPIDLQRAALIAAVEASGPGILTHPTLGVLNVSCEAASFSGDISSDNYAEVTLGFVEAGQQSFPSILNSTSDATISAAVTVALAVTNDAVAAVNLASGAQGSAALATAASRWSAQVEASAGDATAVIGLATLLPGPYGRYSAGANAGFTSPQYTTAQTIGDLISAAADERAAIATAAAGLGAAAQSGTAGEVAAAGQSLVGALYSACADPADAVRLLLDLQTVSPTTSGSADVDAAMDNLFHRSAIVFLAQASAAYQPSSQTDAVTVLGQITAALDAEIEVAGDSGEDDTFNALCDLRRTIVEDLTQRGASLAPVRTFTFGASLPDVVLAQRIYRDPSRADQLTTQVNEVHPLFMPASFQALAA